MIGIKISTDFLLKEDGEPVKFTSFKNRKKRSPEGLDGNKITVVEFQAAYSFYPPFLPYYLLEIKGLNSRIRDVCSLKLYNRKSSQMQTDADRQTERQTAPLK